MEKIIGIKLNDCATQRGVAISSRFTAGMLRYLVENRAVSFSRILYPYADMLSLSDRPGTESTSIFGGAVILRGVEPDGEAISAGISNALAWGADMSEVEALLPLQKVEFPLNDGNAAACDVTQFLTCGSGGLNTAGDFTMQLSGFLPHWRLREEAKKFASFCELAYRRTKGNICGLKGGRLVLSGNGLELEELFFQKTGCRNARADSPANSE